MHLVSGFAQVSTSRNEVSRTPRAVLAVADFSDSDAQVTALRHPRSVYRGGD